MNKYKKALNCVFSKNFLNILSKTFVYLKKHPMAVLSVCIALAVLAGSQLIACQTALFVHGGANVTSGCHGGDVDPRVLINAICEDDLGGVSDLGGPPSEQDCLFPPCDGSSSTTAAPSGDGSNDELVDEFEDRPNWSYKVKPGKVDILFVVDNSSSMHEEHLNIAGQFDDFMDDIKDLDYRIAMTTVDISSSPCNAGRDYQDGRFIDFEDNSIFLHNSEEDRADRRRRHRENVEFFKKAIVREETKNCNLKEELDRDGCPIDPGDCPTDERAICALNKAFDRRQNLSFFREEPDVHLMMVILSDEDERGSQDSIHNKSKGRYDYHFEPCDEADNFYMNVYNRINPNKHYSIHAIVIPPGDSDCLESQKSDYGGGAYGEKYAEFAQPSRNFYDRHPGLREGSVLSICDRSYSSQLGNLSNYLHRPQPVTIPCVVERAFVKEDSSGDEVRHSIDGKKIVIEEDVSLDSKLTVHAWCRSS